jgi:hypothetical protein
MVDFSKKYHGKGTFFLSLMFFLFMQTYLIYAPIKARPLPIEPIVSYGYVLKAEEMNAGCYFKDCPALNDLRRQFTERTTDLKKELSRAIGYHRVLVVYHPLHSVILVVLKDAGLTYEKAFDLSAIAGTIFIHLGIAYWLFAMFGEGPTTIALFLLAPIVFPGLGLHSIGPTNLSLGFSLFLWAIIIEKRQNFTWALFPLLAAAILMHPVGKIFGLMALFLYFSKAEQPLTKRAKTFLLGGLASVTLTFIAPILIKRPELNADLSSWYPAQWNYLDYLVAAIQQLEHFVTFWAEPIGIWGIVLLLTFCLLMLRKPATNRWFLMGGLLSGALFLSLVYLDPWYGPQLLERVWIPLGIFLIGLLGLVIWYLTRTLFTLGKRFFRQQRTKVALPKRWRTLTRVAFAVSLLLLSCGQAYTHYFSVLFL